MVLFYSLMMGDPFTKTSDFTVDLFKDAMVQVMCYWLLNSGDWLNGHWVDIGWIYDH